MRRWDLGLTGAHDLAFVLAMDDDVQRLLLVVVVGVETFLTWSEVSSCEGRGWKTGWGLTTAVEVLVVSCTCPHSSSWSLVVAAIVLVDPTLTWFKMNARASQGVSWQYYRQGKSTKWVKWCPATHQLPPLMPVITISCGGSAYTSNRAGYKLGQLPYTATT
jgi:hypothetical protein